MLNVCMYIYSTDSFSWSVCLTDSWTLYTLMYKFYWLFLKEYLYNWRMNAVSVLCINSTDWKTFSFIMCWTPWRWHIHCSLVKVHLFIPIFINSALDRTEILKQFSNLNSLAQNGFGHRFFFQLTAYFDAENISKFC